MAEEAVRWNSTAQVALITEWDEINHPDYPKEMLEAIKRIPDNIAAIHNYYNDMTIASFSVGAISYTAIMNNKNGNVWISGVEKINNNGKFDYKPVPEIGINLNIKELAKSINSSNGKITRPQGFAISVNFGSVVGKNMSSEQIDNVIKGSSVGIQVCHIGCGGMIRTQGRQTVITYGLGTSQVSLNGGNMVKLTKERKQDFLKIIRMQ
ncbi:hypothetical protein [Moraxella sp. E33BD]